MSEGFKIRHRKTQLFSEGGMDLNRSQYGWSTTGKIWRSIGALRLHLRQYKKDSIVDWEVQRILGDYKSEFVPAVDLYEPKSKFILQLSSTLVALLKFSTKSEVDVSWEKLRDVLAPIYHEDMTYRDVLIVVVNAFEEAKRIPEFKFGTSAFSLFEILDTARREKSMYFLHTCKTFDLHSTISFEELVNYQLKFIINCLRFAEKKWCKKQLTA